MTFCKKKHFKSNTSACFCTSVQVFESVAYTVQEKISLGLELYIKIYYFKISNYANEIGITNQ